MKMLMTNEQIGDLITLESFACRNGHYKLTYQCENTILSAFTLQQSKNPLSQQISKVGVWQECFVGEGAAASLPHRTALELNLKFLKEVDRYR